MLGKLRFIRIPGWWLIKCRAVFENMDPQMMEYLRFIRQIMSQFLKAKVVQVARGQNWHANSLATFVSSLTEEVPWLIKVELVAEPSINAG